MNKFLILFAALVCAFQFSNAQTEKGNQTLGLNLQFQYSASTDNYFSNANFSSSISKTKNTNITLGPLYSFFIADKLDLGGSFSLGSYTTTITPYPNNISSSSSHNKNYEAAIYLRKYFLYANKIGIRTGPFIAYNWSNQGFDYPSDQSTYNYGQKGHGYTAGARLEAVYYPSKHLGVSALLVNAGFQHSNNKSYNNTDVDDASGNSAFFNIITNGFGLSLFYVLGGK